MLHKTLARTRIFFSFLCIVLYNTKVVLGRSVLGVLRLFQTGTSPTDTLPFLLKSLSFVSLTPKESPDID